MKRTIQATRRASQNLRRGRANLHQGLERMTLSLMNSKGPNQQGFTTRKTEEEKRKK
jgi:hypothetical protein